MEKNKLIKKYLEGNRRTKNISQVIINHKTRVTSRREAQDESVAHKTLVLKITTDTDSPIYKDWFGNDYLEQIDSHAFDDSLKEVEEGNKIIYSFADHNIDTKNVISSTKRSDTKLYKDENNDYVMEMKLNEEDVLHKKIIELYDNGELNANSFIFLPEEIEIIEGEREEVDYVVKQKKGNLLSIDPVIFPFYPTNEIEMKGKKMQKTVEEETKLAKPASTVAQAETKAKVDKKSTKKETKQNATAEEKTSEETKPEVVEEATSEEKTSEEAKPEVVEEATSEEKTSEETKPEVVEEATSEETEDTEEIIDEAEEVLDKNQDFKALSLKEQRNWLNKIAKRAITVDEVINSLHSKKSQKDQEKRDLVAKKLKKQQGEIMEERSKLERNKLLTRWIQRGAGAVAENIAQFEKVKEDLMTAIAERNAETIEKFGITEDELKLFGQTRSGLTGADNSTGAQIIPVSTDPNVIGQDVISTPEFDGAGRMAMSGLEEKKVVVDVDTFGIAAEKTEGTDADEDNSTVVKVQFTPKRYPISFDYNPLLATHATFVSQKTTNQKNKITNAWLKGFYDSLLTHKSATLASLVAGAGYTGGITSDAEAVEVPAADGVTDNTMDALLLKAEARYGVISEGQFVAYMKPQTWISIKKAAKANGNAALIRVVKDKTMYGNVEVIVRNQYTEDASTTGNVPIVMTKKSSVKIYGGIIVVKDSIEQSFKKEMNTRLVSGRGEAKLCDPQYSTFIVKIVA